MKLILKNRKDFPKCVRQFSELKGICVGECIDKTYAFNPDPMREAGHCHIVGSFEGWICLTRKFQLKEKYTLLHELAHIITHNRYGFQIKSHGKEWKKVVVEIGGTYKAYVCLGYGKKRRYRDYTHRTK
jgi:hypothetical protein